MWNNEYLRTAYTLLRDSRLLRPVTLCEPMVLLSLLLLWLWHGLGPMRRVSVASLLAVLLVVVSEVVGHIAALSFAGEAVGRVSEATPRGAHLPAKSGTLSSVWHSRGGAFLFAAAFGRCFSERRWEQRPRCSCRVLLRAFFLACDSNTQGAGRSFVWRPGIFVNQA